MLVLKKAVRPLRSMADELRAGLEEPEQFKIRYQPIIDGTSKKLELAKALLRWTSPIMGEVLPGRFISIAEQNGLIRKVTRMVLRKVSEDLSDHPDLLVSVNISPLDVTDPLFPDEVDGLLAELGVSPKQVILECTDRIAPEDQKKSASIQEILQERGHAVALYEMETGFASFGFLKMPGYTLLKIDKELLDEALEHAESREVLQDAVTASRSKGFKTLAVGVETDAQAELVDMIGFDLQQGFLHSGSLSLDELVDFSSFGPDRLARTND